MKYMVEKSFIQVLGYIWMPNVCCSQEIELRSYDLESIAENGVITREGIEQWLACNSGDFREVIDFYANIEWHGETLEFPWSQEENEMRYWDNFPDSE